MENDTGSLVLEDLTRRYGDVVALDGLSFSVPQGTMFGFVGPKGPPGQGRACPRAGGALRRGGSAGSVGAAAPRRDARRRRRGPRGARVHRLAITLLLYGQLLTYGFWVAIGVVEEKSSRVVEILLSAIRPRQLLAGKVLGIGLLGAAQLLLVVVAGVALALLAGSLDVKGDILGTVAVIMLFFPLGFALYACLFASAGALVSRQEDLQSTTTPLTILIVGSYIVSFTALQDPGGTLAKVASLVPVSSPLVMPPRLALGQASAVEVLAAVAILLLTIAAVIGFAARVYERAVMRTGKPVRLREALR